MNNYFCIGTMNGLYKNTYFLMQYNNSDVRANSSVVPTMMSISCVSDKKLQFDDTSVDIHYLNSFRSNVQPVGADTLRCLRRVELSTNSKK